eukprot:jgi/Chlat1/7048/Chrsp56S00528
MGTLRPLLLAIQLQGIVIMVVLTLGWLYAARKRRNQVALIQPNNRHRQSAACRLASSQASVTVVLPVKGVRRNCLSNWSTQLSSRYSGALQFIFVTESTQDEAHAAVLSLISSLPAQNSSFARPRVQLVVAGHATTCSQKIHNMLAGVRASEQHSSDYTLFLDDDIRLHPDTVHVLVNALQKDIDAFIATGFPFDIPGNTFASYCIMAYHLPLVVGFSTDGRTPFVWGGCMLLRTSDLLEDRHGCVSALRDGGYSDDLTLAAVASAHSRSVVCPAQALFPQQLESGSTMHGYWNYLRRQLVVMDTYSSAHNRHVNHALLASHCYLSWALVLAILLSCYVLCAHIVLSPLRKAGVASQAEVSASCMLFLSTYGAACMLRYMQAMMAELCAALSSRKPIDVQSYSMRKMLLGLLVHNLVLPLCGVYTALTSHVEWSGVVYTRKLGKVCSICRKE